MNRETQPWSLKAVLLVLAAVAVLGVGSLLFMGGQVSGILSTVGAAVPPPGQGGGPAGGEGDGEAPDDGAGQGGGNGNGGDGADVPLLSVDRPDLLIIKSGEISLQVDAITPALETTTRAIDGLGGYLSGSSRSGAGDEASASGTFRIPADRWDDALVAVRGIGTVLDEHSETDDVTGTVVDLEARIRNLQTTEAALQSIMAQATVIKDVLAVQEELTAVRGEIEGLQSEASHLRAKAAYSTLTVHLGLTPVPVIAQQEARFDPGTEAEAATAHLVKIVQGLEKVGIWFGIVWLPILVGLGLVGGVALVIARRFRSRLDAGAPPLEPGGTGA